MNRFWLMRPVLVFAALFFLSGSCVADDGSDTSVVNEELWVWAEVGEQPDTIFFSRGSGDTWQEPLQLSDNRGLNVVPAVVKLNDGKVFVAWSTYENGESKITYRQETEGGWSEPEAYISGLSQNMAPSLLVDAEGVLWLIFAGFNGVNDEIYYATWQDGQFGTAEAITDNDIPDILPVTGLSPETGSLWVQWSQFSTAGYVKYQSIREDGEWSTPQQVEADIDEENDNSVSEETAEAEFELVIPDVVTDVKSASVHISGNEIQSLPVRSLDIVE